jgi:hypothetical protein
MRAFGTVILIIAVIGLVAALGMDTSVGTSFGRVNNLGLMAERQNYVTVACVALIVAVLMIVFGGRQGRVGVSNPQSPAIAPPPPELTRKCPYCAEPIKSEAIKCRFCASTVEPLSQHEHTQPEPGGGDRATRSQDLSMINEHSVSENFVPRLFLGVIILIVVASVIQTLTHR